MSSGVPKLLNTKETREALHYDSDRSVYRLVQRGLLDPVRLTPTGPLLFPVEDVAALIGRARAPRTADIAAVEPSSVSAPEEPPTSSRSAAPPSYDEAA